MPSGTAACASCSCCSLLPAAERLPFLPRARVPVRAGEDSDPFCRRPVLCTAGLRRIFCAPPSAFFDDIATVTVLCHRGFAQNLTRQIFGMGGLAPSPEKAQHVAQCRPYLGAFLSRQVLAEAGDLIIVPKWRSKQGAILELKEFVDEGGMSASRASKVNGKSSWVATNSAGRLAA